MNIPMDIATQLSAAVETMQEMKRDLAVHTEILTRIETKQDHTNGSVTELQAWRIKVDAENETRKEISANNDANFRGPIISGLVVGAILLAVELVLKLT